MCVFLANSVVSAFQSFESHNSNSRRRGGKSMGMCWHALMFGTCIDLLELCFSCQ